MPARKPRTLVRWSSRSSNDLQFVGLLALHGSVGMLDAYDLALFCERRGVSYNAITDNDKLVFTVPRSKKAWHLRNGNPFANGLCVTTGVEQWSRRYWLDHQMRKVEHAAWWMAVCAKAEGLDVMACSQANVREVCWQGNKPSGGLTQHKIYTWATKDGSHTDVRGFPMDVMVEMAQAHAGYADWENKDAYEGPTNEKKIPAAVKQAINDKHEQFRDLLGNATRPFHLAEDGESWVREYQLFEDSPAQSRIVWSPQFGAHLVYGGIAHRYDDEGGVEGRFGPPNSDEVDCPHDHDGDGRMNLFGGGFIHYVQGAGVFTHPGG